jgi:16S rRNA (guanine527-N7)-methyltransferase
VIARLERILGAPVSRETLEKLARYEGMVGEACKDQNLVSKATLDDFFERHIIDSAQLITFAPPEPQSWLDIGSGAGLPGIVISILTGQPMTLVEPRRLRASFLSDVVSELSLDATVVQSRVESVHGKFDMVTARAVAKLDKLLEISRHLSTGKTVWLLPKGQSGVLEVEEASRKWQAVFHVEQSVTLEDSVIVTVRELKGPKRV